MSDSNLPAIVSSDDLERYGSIIGEALKSPVGRFLVSFLKNRYSKKIERQDGHNDMIDASMRIQVDADAKSQASIIEFSAELQKSKLIKQYIQENGGPHFLSEQIRKDYNVDEAIKEAFKDVATMGETDKASQEGFDDNWFTRWRDMASTFSDTESHKIWGKILAGEIREPGTFSYRTMDVLKNLTQKEASLFQKVAPFILSGVNGFYFMVRPLYANTQITHSDLIKLTNSGLVTDFSQTAWTPLAEATKYLCAYNDYILMLQREVPTQMEIDIVVFSEAAFQISRLIQSEFSEEYLRSIKSVLISKDSDIKVSYHKIIQRSDPDFNHYYLIEGVDI